MNIGLTAGLGFSSASQASFASSAGPAGGAPAQESNAAEVSALERSLENAAILEERAIANVENDKFSETCRTCKNRKYQDESNDPAVSFKTPQGVSAEESAAAVMGHEQEHVSHEQARARVEGREVVSQSVVLHGAVCAECGRPYVAGGTTTTITRAADSEDLAKEFEVGRPEQDEVGRTIDENA